ncbi:MAG: phosphoribosylformylglycinamidine synthase subunit PurQ [Deltaproteobacteria bacterium]|nr:phosphoribosylformylglycinamidine synthase subunit PurQ [Deltaproteobacteria bacterium]
MSTFGIVVFPGSNCDHDVAHVVEAVAGAKTRMLWHKEPDLHGVDAVILPGGFSYGDYLRAGALAHLSPVMDEVVRFAKRGGPVLGICNGFQVLCESRLLPGALMRNEQLTFVCKDVTVRVERGDTSFTRGLAAGTELMMPIAHNEGNFVIDPPGLERLEGEGQVVFRYLENPNGSMNGIAGICNASGNVVGLMPHPERSAEGALGSTDGAALFRAALTHLESAA